MPSTMALAPRTKFPSRAVGTPRDARAIFARRPVVLTSYHVTVRGGGPGRHAVVTERDALRLEVDHRVDDGGDHANMPCMPYIPGPSQAPCPCAAVARPESESPTKSGVSVGVVIISDATRSGCTPRTRPPSLVAWPRRSRGPPLPSVSVAARYAWTYTWKGPPLRLPHPRIYARGRNVQYQLSIQVQKQGGFQFSSEMFAEAARCCWRRPAERTQGRHLRRPVRWTGSMIDWQTQKLGFKAAIEPSQGGKIFDFHS